MEIEASFNNSNNFTGNLRHWRKRRKMSQLDLALEANVSQRHVSWLETGKSKPSREMIIKLSDAMDVPLRERNAILNSAGFAKIYSNDDLSAPSMASVNAILSDILTHQNPYPTFVLDRHWNIKMKNEAADMLFNILGDPEQVWQDIGDDGEFNIALLSVHPKGLRRFISNWDDVASPFITRLKKEAIESEDPKVLDKFKHLMSIAGELPSDTGSTELLPVLPLEFNLGNIVLKLCSVISTFGTAQDITSNELRIETFYPADEITQAFLRNK